MRAARWAFCRALALKRAVCTECAGANDAQIPDVQLCSEFLSFPGVAKIPAFTPLSDMSSVAAMLGLVAKFTLQQ